MFTGYHGLLRCRNGDATLRFGIRESAGVDGLHLFVEMESNQRPEDAVRFRGLGCIPFSSETKRLAPRSNSSSSIPRTPPHPPDSILMHRLPRPDYFTKTNKFEKDIVVLSVSYILRDHPGLRKLASVLCTIYCDDRSDGEPLSVSESCAEYIVQLLILSQIEATEAAYIMSKFTKMIEKVDPVQLEADCGDQQTTQNLVLTSMMEKATATISSGAALKCSHELRRIKDIATEEGTTVLDIVLEANRLVPVPLVQSAVADILDLLQSTQVNLFHDEM